MFRYLSNESMSRDAESLLFWVEFDFEFTTFLIRISEFDSEFTTLLTKISEFDSEFMRFVKSEFEFDSEFSETCRIQRVGARFRIPYLVVGDQIIKMATTRCNFDQKYQLLMEILLELVNL